MTAPPPLKAILVDEGPHHAVFVKPAGMTVVGGRGVPRPTLLDLAVARWPTAKPVHRLDKPTHGVCIVAKSTYGQQALSDAFRRHLVDKRYLALVEGATTWEKLDIDARLARIDDPDAKKGPMAHQTIDNENGVRALTRVKVIARSSTHTLVEARPETGRMHQIRCHLSHVGHPIVGDAQYGAKGPLQWPDDKGLGLVAFAVSFPLPQGGRAFVVGDVPEAMRKALSDANVGASAIAKLAEEFKKLGASASAGVGVNTSPKLKRPQQAKSHVPRGGPPSSNANARRGPSRGRR